MLYNSIFSDYSSRKAFMFVCLSRLLQSRRPRFLYRFHLFPNYTNSLSKIIRSPIDRCRFLFSLSSGQLYLSIASIQAIRAKRIISNGANRAGLRPFILLSSGTTNGINLKAETKGPSPRRDAWTLTNFIQRSINASGFN